MGVSVLENGFRSSLTSSSWGIYLILLKRELLSLLELGYLESCCSNQIHLFNLCTATSGGQCTHFFCSSLVRSEFIFINPNSKGQCGCGESFMTTGSAEANKK